MECSVCLEAFTRDCNVPKVLNSCGHTICNICSENCVLNKGVQCPICRTITPETPFQLKTNFQLLDVLSCTRESGDTAPVAPIQGRIAHSTASTPPLTTLSSPRRYGDLLSNATATAYATTSLSRALSLSRRTERQLHFRTESWHDHFISAGLSSLTAGNFRVNHSFNKIVSLYKGDISTIPVDAIVNTTNCEMTKGGEGVSRAIFNAGGRALEEECLIAAPCMIGDAKITAGHRLLAKHVIHTVGPINEDEKLLSSCYTSCLQLAADNGLTSIAFPCISTGLHGYPFVLATIVALETTRIWLEKSNNQPLKQIIFTVYGDDQYQIYEDAMRRIFPSNQ